MKIELSRLESSIKNSLLPVYLVSGDEPLQQGEAVDLIRQKARDNGFLNREVLHVEGQFDWQQLPALCLTQSLFAEKNLIELNLPTGKPGIQGSAAIEKVMHQLSSDNVVIVITGKLDGKVSNTKWYKAINEIGGVVPVWPLEGPKLAQWLKSRAQKKGLQIEDEGLKVLLQRVEGNLLAAAQEIEKLYALYGSTSLSADHVSRAVEDNARFDVFKLTDGLLSGNMGRVSRVLDGLMAEKLAAPVVLWAITRELRLLAALSYEKSVTGRLDKTFQKNRVWDSRKNAYIQALGRGKLSQWQSMLMDCVTAEKIIKGEEDGNEWDLMHGICLKACRPSLCA